MNRKYVRYIRIFIRLVVILLALAFVSRFKVIRPDTLHVAAAKGNLARIEKLLSKPGADVNAKSPEGKTPLEAAIEADQKDVAAFLIERGADVKGRNSSGYTPLLQAISRGEEAIARLLLEKGASPNARVGSDAPTCQGETPLILAVQRGDVTMIKMLLEKGADPELASYGGAKAIDYATEVSNSEAVEILKQAKRK